MRETGQHLLLVLARFQLSLVPPGVRHLLLIRHLQGHALETRGAMLPLLQLLIRHPALLFNLFHHLRVDLLPLLALVLVSLQAPSQPPPQTEPLRAHLRRQQTTLRRGSLRQLAPTSLVVVFVVLVSQIFPSVGVLDHVSHRPVPRLRLGASESGVLILRVGLVGKHDVNPLLFLPARPERPSRVELVVVIIHGVIFPGHVPDHVQRRPQLLDLLRLHRRLHGDVLDILGLHEVELVLGVLVGQVLVGDVDPVVGALLLHGEVELIGIPVGRLLPQNLERLLLLVEIARAEDVVLLLLEEAELAPLRRL
mmetsp:Transcript_7660/g.31069  ORF Transcript_7660/g.31069 Transcript_7660/m.31069 type:complete len:309 (-) Transcript_7660:123-1049(-)